MSAIKPHIARVCKAFGHWADDVRRLAQRNPRFRSLCDDYGMTVETLDVLERRKHPTDAEKMAEYRTLRRELERDLKTELLASSSRSDD